MSDKLGDWKYLIIVAVIAIIIWQVVGYGLQLTNYNSIPIYDKACGLNYTQTWDNAYKFFFIDTSNCNINTISH